MSLWVVALVAGAGFVVVQYGRRGAAARAWLPAALRLTGITLLVALLLDAPVGRARVPPPLVALDASASWLRGADSAAWRAALGIVRAAAPDSALLFGDSVRALGTPAALAGLLPNDNASLARPVVDRALARGRPMLVVTDGELADGAALRDLPGGSRIEVVARPAAVDLAVASLELPRAAVAGDTAALRVGLVAGARGAPAASLAITVNDVVVSTVSIDALAPRAERSLDIRARLAGSDGPAIVRAIVRAPGDIEPRNDTLAAAVDLARAASAVFVSTSPDFDARYALSVLRGALALPTRGYLRVAPGAWRVDGPLTPIAESEVRRALRDAPVAILHGDTAAFGAPRAATNGALALIAPPGESPDEWYAASAPPSPLETALGGLPWDSLPPLAVGASVPRGDFVMLAARRGRESAQRPIITGTETPRRTAIVAASGFWRWRFRGGASSDAFGALWGSLFDWLVAEHVDRRAAVPAANVLRAGDPVQWQRGSARDTLVAVLLRRLSLRGADSGRADSVTLHFGADRSIVESPPLPPGIYHATTRGGSALLAVSASRELLPREASVRSGRVGSETSMDAAPRVRRFGWLFGVAIAALCAEWLARRRIGLR